MANTQREWAVIERADTIDGEPVIYVGLPDERAKRGDFSLGFAEHDVARVYDLADARLISAAPDLLAALKNMVHQMSRDHVERGRPHRDCPHCESIAAIHKAEG